MPAMEELNERFRADRFAAQAGVEIRSEERRVGKECRL